MVHSCGIAISFEFWNSQIVENIRYIEEIITRKVENIFLIILSIGHYHDILLGFYFVSEMIKVCKLWHWTHSRDAIRCHTIWKMTTRILGWSQTSTDYKQNLIFTLYIITNKWNINTKSILHTSKCYFYKLRSCTNSPDKYIKIYHIT